MRARTIFLYLAGQEAAVQEVAASRWSLPVGALLTISAGFAREYDGEFLLREPWHVARPLGASLVSATVLFCLIYGATRLRKSALPPVGRAYLSFLGLFWMTAPLAWLYAIPYERFLDPVGAMRANLWTLGLVAAWRVLLFTRAIAGVMNVSFWAMLFLIMLFADAVVITTMAVADLPILDIMGGVEMSPAEALLRDVRGGLIGWSVVSAPVWIVAALVALRFLKARWTIPPADAPTTAQRASRSALLVALASILVWAPILPFTQAQQRARWQVEDLMRNGRVADALAEMSRRGERAFPARWDPPPRTAYGESVPTADQIAVALADDRIAPWVSDIYKRKLEVMMGRPPHLRDNEAPVPAESHP